MSGDRVASLAALLRELFPRGLLWGEQGAISAAQMLIARGVTVGAVPEALPVAPLVDLADEYISGAHRDSTVAQRPGVIRDFVKWVVGSRLGEPSPEGRGTPSEAQMQAAREGWSGNLPLPSDAELRVLIEAVNRAAWPDRGVRTGSEETPQ